MAARAGSVHLISSMDRKPSRKGGARPRPKQPHPVPQGPPFSIKCLLTTGCPPEAHNQSQLKHTASSRPKHTQTLGGRSATPPTQELTSFPVWAGQQHVIATTSASNHRQLPSSRTGPSIAPPYSASLTDMASPLTSCHAPKASSRGSKVTTASGTRPPIAEAKSQAPMSKHWPVKPRPIGSNKTCINAHAHTPHSARNTPTRLIRPI